MMSRQEICEQFKIDGFDGAVVYAGYEYENYEGDAAVIFVSDGKLYMVSSSHCSCNGLEGTWEPDEVTVEMLRKMTAERYGGGEYQDTKAAKHTLALLDQLAEPDFHALEASLVLQAL